MYAHDMYYFVDDRSHQVSLASCGNQSLESEQKLLKRFMVTNKPLEFN